MDIILHNNDILIPLDGGVISGTITEAVNEFSSLSVKLLPSCIAYDLISPFITHFEIIEGEKQLFYGRVLTETPSMSNSGLCSKSIVCEDRMAYLCDSIQPYTETRQYSGDSQRNGLQEFVDLLLENHNSQVEEYKKIYRGNVTLQTHETTENVYKGLNYETTWEAIKSKLLDVYGGEMRVREADGKLYLDYDESLGVTRSTKIEVGKNMQSAERTLNPSAVVSRLIPLGAKLTREVIDDEGNISEEETEERLNIESVNNGIRYIESDVAMSLYGIQYKTVVWDDIHDPQILMTRGLEYLTEQNKAVATHNVTAVDLSYLGLSADKINLFDCYPVYNPHIGFDDTLEVIKKTTDIFSPFTPSFTLGDKSVPLSDIITKSKDKVSEVEKKINSVKTESNNQISAVYSFVSTSSSELQQNTNNLIAQVTENTVSKSAYNEFSETVRNILQMDADGTSMIFQTITEELSRIEGEQQSKYSEILKYIRFENGNIILGEVGNAITLTLENDILAFRQNGTVVAYLSHNRFRVVDGEFIKSLRIGKFAFVPRENGNLSFKKVGGE